VLSIEVLSIVLTPVGIMRRRNIGSRNIEVSPPGVFLPSLSLGGCSSGIVFLGVVLLRVLLTGVVLPRLSFREVVLPGLSS